MAEQTNDNQDNEQREEARPATRDTPAMTPQKPSQAEGERETIIQDIQEKESEGEL